MLVFIVIVFAASKIQSGHKEGRKIRSDLKRHNTAPQQHREKEKEKEKEKEVKERSIYIYIYIYNEIQENMCTHTHTMYNVPRHAYNV